MAFVIGDIHGCVHTLQNLVQEIHKIEEDAQLVFVGDYVDRGRWSLSTVGYLMELQKKGDVCLRGNHDDVFSWFINGKCKSRLSDLVYGSINTYTVFNWWFHSNGFGSTVKSFCDISDLDPTNYHDHIHEVVVRLNASVSQEHRDFFENLPLYWSNDKCFACHGWFSDDELKPDDVWISSDRAMDILWGRFEELEGRHPKWGKVGVFGHSMTQNYGEDQPIRQDLIRLVDTGCFDGGGLSAYHDETDSFIQVPTDPKDLVS